MEMDNRELLEIEMAASWASIVAHLEIDEESMGLALNSAPILPGPGSLLGWHLQLAPEHAGMFSIERANRICDAVRKLKGGHVALHFRIEPPKLTTPMQIARILALSKLAVATETLH